MTEQAKEKAHHPDQISPLAEYLAAELPKDLLDSLKEAKDLLEQHQQIPQDSSDPEVRKELRLLNEKLRTSYWTVLQGLCNYRMQRVDENTDHPDFSTTDVLLINYGYLAPQLSSVPSELFLKKNQEKAPLSRYQFYLLTDYLKDLHSCYFNRPVPASSVDCSREEKIRVTEDLAEKHKKRRQALQGILLQNLGEPHHSEKGEKFLKNLEEKLGPRTEVTLRTQTFRYAPDRSQIEMREAASLYDKAREDYGKWLLLLKDALEDKEHLLTITDELESLCGRIEATKELAVSIREERAKDEDKRKRYAAKYKGKGAPELRMEIQEKIKQIRSFSEMSARRSRMVPSPFYQSQPHDMLSLKDLENHLGEMPDLDPEIFHTVRLRARGYPRICLVPGKGDGIYDWEEHTLLFPLVPTRSAAQTVAHAFALMRWDADEDRELKDTYASLKDNKGKSHTGLQEAFVKDYLIWITKETR
ncbi:MAG TPA: hypothetical protein PK364_13100, partial [Synergistaceae bacterium]|nr:hypothetical protein [Synergistaceae bacterium]